MNLDLFLIQNIFQEFDFSQNYYYLAQLDDHNPIITRNPNPTRIQENNESSSRIRNPSLTMIHDVTRNPNPTSIQDVIRNPYPTWIEDSLTYNGNPITWARAKKIKEALHMLMPSIWA